MKNLLKCLTLMFFFASFTANGQQLVESGITGPTAWRNFNLPTPVPGPPQGVGTPYGNYTGQPANWQTVPTTGPGWQSTVIDENATTTPPRMWVNENAGQVYGVLFRTSFNLLNPAGTYVMTLRPDNQCEVFINGTQIGQIYNWSNGIVTVCVPASVFQAGNNIVAIQATEWLNTASRMQFDLTRVNSPIPVTINPGDEKYCTDDAPVQYTGTPAGGVWSGPGISSSGLFTPSAANIGANTLTYTVTSNGNPCPTVSTGSVIAEVKECCPDDMASFIQVKHTFVNTSTPSGSINPDDTCCALGFSSVTWTVCELFSSGPFSYVQCYQVHSYNLQYSPTPGAQAYQICLKVVDCEGCEDETCGEWTDLKFIGEGKSSDNDSGIAPSKNDIKILPNPNNGSFQIAVTGFEKGQNSEMFITDLSGKRMLTIDEPSERILINNMDLSAGMYVFVHKSNSGTQTEKILIQK